MCGKQIACPKCKKAMVLPALQAFEPSAIQQSVPPNPSSGTQQQPPEFNWGDPGAFTDTATQANNFANSSGRSWDHQQSPSSFAPSVTFSGSPASSFKSPKKKAPRKQEADLTEKESGLQASGIFLISLPLIATLLPLFGVQLRRLASLGNYAPIGALFLGLIGSGIIVWARRNRSDAYAMGAIGVACSLVFGIGGYSLLEYMDNQAESELKGSDVAFQPASPSLPSNGNANQPGSASSRLGDSEASGSSKLGQTIGGAPSESSERFSRMKNNASKFEQDPRKLSELVRIQSQGFSDITRIKAQGGESPKVLNLVGNESFSSSLFARSPVKGVCGFSMGMSIHLVPIEQVDQDWKAAFVTRDNEVLQGMRFAFDGTRIVGFQGLLNTDKAGTPRETEWYGRKTEDVKESLNPDPGKTGIMCFENGPDLTGFGWVKL
jgi:hypothetical protein